MKKLFLIFFSIVFLNTPAITQQEKSDNTKRVQEQLLYSTVRILCLKNDNGKLVQCSGTGFYFDFAGTQNVQRPYIITNKHVVENSIIGGFNILQRDKNGQPDTVTSQITIPNFAKRWIPHPDSTVDLCIMPLAALINEAQKKNIELYYTSFTSAHIPKEEEWKNLDVIEKVLIVGYPIGLVDTVNNIPLIRTGTTSSPPYLNYNGKEEFVIDAGCFPGSSGSPIIYIPDAYKVILSGKPSSSILLLGVLYAGPEMKINGEIVVKKIDTKVKPFSESYIPINLGYVIKANRITEFRKIIDKK